MTDLFLSVIVYTYNRKDYIEKAVLSVSRQTIPRNQYEIIVVKGFEDTQLDNRLSKLADKILFVPEKSHGKKISAAFKESKGNIIFLLDDDDEFVPDKLEKVRQIFANYSNISFLHNSIIKIDDNGIVIHEHEEDAPKSIIRYNLNRGSDLELSHLLKYRANWYGSCMSFSRSVLENSLDILEKVNQSIDPVIFLLAVNSGKDICAIGERLTRYRVHESTTNIIAAQTEYLNNKIKFYSRTKEVYDILLQNLSDERIHKIINVLVSHMNLIVLFLRSDTKRSKLLAQIMDLLLSMKDAFSIYYFTWIMLGLLKIFNKRLALGIYYAYNIRSLNALANTNFL